MVSCFRLKLSKQIGHRCLRVLIGLLKLVIGKQLKVIVHIIVVIGKQLKVIVHIILVITKLVTVQQLVQVITIKMLSTIHFLVIE